MAEKGCASGCGWYPGVSCSAIRGVRENDGLVCGTVLGEGDDVDKDVSQLGAGFEVLLEELQACTVEAVSEAVPELRACVACVRRSAGRMRRGGGGDVRRWELDEDEQGQRVPTLLARLRVPRSSFSDVCERV